jgi:hypothetical protein
MSVTARGTDFTIVTAANDGYFPLLEGLLSSLAPLGKVPVTVLDLGLSAQQRDELRGRGIATPAPGWDIEVPAVVRSRHGEKIQRPDSFKAFTAQPFLPKYAQGEILFWIDADAWLQHPGVVDLFLAEARRERLAIALEVDRCYGPPYWRLKSHLPDFVRSFGLKDGLTLAKTMTANVGVLAMKRDLPHWKLWQDATRHAFKRFAHQRSQQMAMQHVIHISKAPTAFLPALGNWQTWEATPLLDEASGFLCEPQPPYAPIGIIHNAQEDKNALFDVKTTSGRTIRATMRRESWPAVREEPVPVLA